MAVAKLGGYLARSKDPPPGNMVVWRGLTRLMDIHLGFDSSRGVVDNRKLAASPWPRWWPMPAGGARLVPGIAEVARVPANPARPGPTTPIPDAAGTQAETGPGLADFLRELGCELTRPTRADRPGWR